MKRCYRYPLRAVAGECALGGLGLALTLGPLGLMGPAPVPSAVLAAAAVLFLVYCGRAVARYFRYFELDNCGITARGPLGAAIRWEELRAMRLSYYTTWRDRAVDRTPDRAPDRTAGWMQLELRGARRSIGVDSALMGFDELAAVAAREASRRGHRLDERTRSNLAALGISVGAECRTC